MLPEPAEPAHAALDLLARANELATTVTAAIAAGDGVLLSALLEEREIVVAAAVAASAEAMAGSPSVTVRAQLEQATRAALAGGSAAAAAALTARDLVVAELAVLDARRVAVQEYQLSRPSGTFDVVL